MKRAIIPIAVTLLSGLATVQCAFAQGGFTVVPFEFDPYGTHLVAAEWKGGLGCPTNANTAPFLPPDFSTVGSGTYTDLACPSGDPSGDTRVEGLLLVKTGPQNNDASAGAVIQGVKGTKLKELGYDLRKPGSGTGANVVGDQSDPRGSQCDAEATTVQHSYRRGPRGDLFPRLQLAVARLRLFGAGLAASSLGQR
jgi:hypothetical protein